MSRLPILRATIAEAFGRRVVAWGAAASLAFLGLFAIAFALLFREITQSGVENAVQTIASGGILTVLGLYVVSFLASFLALTLASGSVSAEIDAGVTQAVAVRPITRWSWYLQRWAGLVIIVSSYVAILAGAVLLIARVISGYRAISAFNLMLLMMAMVAFLVTVGMLASNRLSTMAAGVVQFSYFGISWLGGLVGFIGAVSQRSALINTSTAVSILAPSDGLWRAASYCAAPRGINLSSITGSTAQLPFATFAPASAVFLGWSLVLVMLTLAGGVLSFSRRDM